MQITQRAFVATQPSTCSKVTKRSQTVRVCCAQQERKNFATESAKLLSAGLLSAALVFGTPAADAKVVLVQPDVKNFVTGAEPARQPSSGGGSTKQAKAKAPPKAAMTSEGGDVKGIILPLSLVVLGGGAFAWSAADPGLAKMMEEGGTKNSWGYAGYETVLKETPFFGNPSGSIPSSLPANNAPKGSSKKGAKKK